MKKQGVTAVALSTVISAGAFFASAAYADKTIDQILKVGQTKTSAGQKSQKRIDALSEETSSILQKFKRVNKDIEGLKVYNAQYERQLESQRKKITELEKSIAQVTVLDRQIAPLIMDMISGLEQFVELDVPFRLAARQARVENLRANQDSSDFTVAEKFRQVLDAYSIEAEYGRKIEVYTDTVEIDGQDLQVNMLAVGRVALVYQTKDAKKTGAWDKTAREWVPISDGEYRAAILNGIKIAKKQASTNVMHLPISAPEANQ